MSRPVKATALRKKACSRPRQSFRGNHKDLPLTGTEALMMPPHSEKDLRAPSGLLIQPLLQMHSDEIIVIQMRVGGVDPVDLFHLAR